jgi:hypothetical protein
MLRIQINEQPEVMSFSLEGSLAGPWVAELEKCWQAARLSQPAAAVVVKLGAVTFVDEQGKDLLCRMRRQGARIVPTGCLMKAIVEIIEADICKQRGEVV